MSAASQSPPIGDRKSPSPPSTCQPEPETARVRDRAARLATRLLELGPVRQLLARRPASTAVLMYHGVVPDGTRPVLWTQLERSAFAAQLRYLAEHRPVISVPHLIDGLQGRRTLPDHAVAITFDDGYFNVLDQALPELERFGLPATLFMTAGHFTGDLAPGQLLWFDQIYDSHGDQLVLGFAETVYRRTRILKRMPEETRQKVVAQLYGAEFARRPVDPDHPRRLMSLEELKRLADSPLMTIGAHSLTHGLLTRMPQAQARDEISRSRQVLQGLLQQPIETFAFPDGALDETVTQLVRQAGFRAAFSTRPGAVRRGDDRFTLRRFPVGQDTSLDRFALILQGLDEVLASLPSRPRWKEIYG